MVTEDTTKKRPITKEQGAAMEYNSYYATILRLIEISPVEHQLIVDTILSYDNPTHFERFTALVDSFRVATEYDYRTLESFGQLALSNELDIENVQLPTLSEFLMCAEAKAEFMDDQSYNDEAFMDSIVYFLINLELELGNLNQTDLSARYDYFNQQRSLTMWANLDPEERQRLIDILVSTREIKLDRNDAQLAANISELLSNGMLIIDVADSLNVTSTALITYMRDVDLQFDQEVYQQTLKARFAASKETIWVLSDEEIAAIGAQIQSGVSVETIASSYGMSVSTLRRNLDQRGILTVRNRRLHELNQYFAQHPIDFKAILERRSSLAKVYNVLIEQLPGLTMNYLSDQFDAWLTTNNLTEQWNPHSSAKRALDNTQLSNVVDMLKRGMSIPEIVKNLQLSSRSPVDNLLERNGYGGEKARLLNPIYRYKTQVFPTTFLPRILDGEISQKHAAIEISRVLTEQEGATVTVSASTLANWVSQYLRDQSTEG